MRRSAWLIGGSLAVLLAANGARAQDGAADPAPRSAQASDLEEVVVTASRRSEAR